MKPIRFDADLSGHRVRGRTITAQGPYDTPAAREVPRNGHREDPGLPARGEQGRLRAVIFGRLDEVVRPDGKVQNFLGVAIEVAKGECVGAVRILVPALEKRGHRETLRDRPPLLR